MQPVEEREAQIESLPRRRTGFVDVMTRLVREKPLGTAGMLIYLVLLVVGIFANFIAPYGYNEIDLTVRLAAPGPNHLLGCDNLGRDLFSRIIYGARVSLIVGLGGATLSMVVSCLIGMTCGYIMGKYDLIMQRFVDAWQSFPMLFILLTVMAIVGGGIPQIILVLGITSGIGGSRGPRALVFWTRENMWVEAARVIGAPTSRVLFKHILLNILPFQILNISQALGGMIMREAGLSFLGFGLPPPIPSWGGMISGAGRTYMLLAPWMLLWPGLALAAVIFGCNVMGDGLRDVLDPRLRGGLGRFGGGRKKEGAQIKEE